MINISRNFSFYCLVFIAVFCILTQLNAQSYYYDEGDFNSSSGRRSRNPSSYYHRQLKDASKNAAELKVVENFPHQEVENSHLFGISPKSVFSSAADVELLERNSFERFLALLYTIGDIIETKKQQFLDIQENSKRKKIVRLLVELEYLYEDAIKFIDQINPDRTVYVPELYAIEFWYTMAWRLGIINELIENDPNVEKKFKDIVRTTYLIMKTTLTENSDEMDWRLAQKRLIKAIRNKKKFRVFLIPEGNYTRYLTIIEISSGLKKYRRNITLLSKKMDVKDALFHTSRLNTCIFFGTSKYVHQKRTKCLIINLVIVLNAMSRPIRKAKNDTLAKFRGLEGEAEKKFAKLVLDFASELLPLLKSFEKKGNNIDRDMNRLNQILKKLNEIHRTLSECGPGVSTVRFEESLHKTLQGFETSLDLTDVNEWYESYDTIFYMIDNLLVIQKFFSEIDSSSKSETGSSNSNRVLQAYDRRYGNRNSHGDWRYPYLKRNPARWYPSFNDNFRNNDQSRYNYNWLNNQ